MKRVFACLLVLCLALPMAAGAWERDLVPGQGRGSMRGFVIGSKRTSVELYGWNSTLHGDVNVDGLVLDLKSEAGFNTKTRLGFTATHAFNTRNSLTLTYNSFENSGTINKAVTFQNRNYQANASINVKTHWVDMTWAHLLSVWGQNQSSAKTHSGYLDALLGIKFSKASLDVNGRDNVNAVVQGSWSENFPIPYIGVGMGAPVSDNLWLMGHLKWLSVNAGGGNAKTLDVDINAALRLNPRSQDAEWHLVLGYRTFGLDGESNNDKIDFGYRGPTFGVMARF
jgi:hypothetical protein